MAHWLSPLGIDRTVLSMYGVPVDQRCRPAAHRLELSQATPEDIRELEAWVVRVKIRGEHDQALPFIEEWLRVHIEASDA